MDTSQYKEQIKTDVTILGAGPGGYVAAIRAAQEGLSVVLIEKEVVGGMCLNWGCIPSKSLMRTAELFESIREGEKFGLTGVDFASVKPDWKKMNQRAVDIVGRLTKGVEMLLKKNGVQILYGKGVILDPSHLTVNDTLIETKDLIIATGSHYPIPSFIQEADVSRIQTPRTIYSIEKLPETMLIIGGGVIGIEFAILFSILGVSIEIVEKHEPIMPYLDDEMLVTLKQMLKKRKITTHLGWEAVQMKPEGLVIRNGKEEKVVQAEVYLSALPRSGNLDGVVALLDKGLSTKDGFIVTDLRCRTTLPHVYAIGDINGRYMLAHVASAEGTTAVETILGKGRDLVYDMMPYNLYTQPEFASVGLTEKEALERGFLVATGKFPFTANGKALAEGRAEGFIKVVFEKEHGEILGVHIVAPNATDLIGESVMAMQVESTVWDVAASVHPHPTLSEAFLEATFKGIQKPVHIL